MIATPGWVRFWMGNYSGVIFLALKFWYSEKKQYLCSQIQKWIRCATAWPLAGEGKTSHCCFYKVIEIPHLSRMESKNLSHKSTPHWLASCFHSDELQSSFWWSDVSNPLYCQQWFYLIAACHVTASALLSSCSMVSQNFHTHKTSRQWVNRGISFRMVCLSMKHKYMRIVFDFWRLLLTFFFST